MEIQTQNFASLVNGMATTIQGTCATTLDLAVGSVTRALVEASASVALWLQYLLIQVLSMTRLATSTGSDVDSWVGDFGLSRLSAPFATGAVTLTSFSPEVQASTIPSGALVRSGDGAVIFSVTGGPYTRPIGTASITVPCICTVAGPIGNVQAGVVSVLGSAIPGIDTVNNAFGFLGGGDAESDAALRTRFVSYVNTRAQGTVAAIVYAARTVKQTISCTVLEGVTIAGLPSPGTVSVVVADGDGVPDAVTLAAVQSAIDAVRPVGTIVVVVSPVLIPANIAITIVIDLALQAGESGIMQAVQSLITTYISGLAVGDTLRISRLAALCFQASAAIEDVTQVTINGSSVDVGGGSAQLVTVSGVSVSVVTS